MDVMKGFFVFEGIDGAGKSTVCESVREELEKESFRVRLTREPTNDEIGSLIRDGCVEGLSPEAEALLFVADRAVHTKKIEKWTDAGEIVLCDRYFASTVAYQSVPLNGAALDREWLISMNEPVTVVPDMTFLLDIEAEKSLLRVGSRGEKSKFETLEYLIKVRREYLYLAERYGFTVIDADRDRSEVSNEIVALIKERL